MKSVLVAAAMSCSAAILAAQDKASASPPTPIPEGKGKAEVQQFCSTACHGVETYTKTRRTPEQWKKVVTEMIALGAKPNAEQAELIAAYMGEHFKLTVNVNKASARQLADGLEVPIKVGIAITAHRTKNGPFATIEDLALVPGLDAKSLEAKKDRIVF
jgi:competence ComEA-like helix-hairpin-helix protein